MNAGLQWEPSGAPRPAIVPGPQVEQLPPPRPRTPWRTAIAILATALLAGSAGGLAAHEADQLGRAQPAAAPQPTAAPSASQLAGPALDVAGVVARIEPAIVTIHASATQGTVTSMSAGTGIVLTPDGTIVTNAHVVQGATTIQVTGSDGKQHTARVVGADTFADVAVLRISGVSGLATAELGSSASVRVGDDVVAIGDALDLGGAPTVTSGIVSAVGRSFDTDHGTMTGLIQTDAAISSGSSGGALANAQGQVVGITTMTATPTRGGSAENLNFAIPIDGAMTVVHTIEAQA